MGTLNELDNYIIALDKCDFDEEQIVFVSEKVLRDVERVAHPKMKEGAAKYSSLKHENEFTANFVSIMHLGKILHFTTSDNFFKAIGK